MIQSRDFALRANHAEQCRRDSRSLAISRHIVRYQRFPITILLRHKQSNRRHRNYSRIHTFFLQLLSSLYKQHDVRAVTHKHHIRLFAVDNRISAFQHLQSVCITIAAGTWQVLHILTSENQTRGRIHIFHRHLPCHSRFRAVGRAKHKHTVLA